MKIWEHTKRAHRFEIHIVTTPLDEIRRLSETVAFGSDPSLADAERVFCVHDTSVFLIHVAMYELTHEVKCYYDIIMRRRGGADYIPEDEHFCLYTPSNL